MTDLRPFQRKFMKATTAPGIDTAVLSLPRGNGKSWLAARLVATALTPGNPAFVPGTESVLAAASIEQARIVFRFARAMLEKNVGADEYRVIDSATRAAILHMRSNTRLRVAGSNGRTVMGLVGCPLVIADEPGSWDVNGGELLADAILTSQGKPESPLRAVFVGTLAPARGGWWHNLVNAGSNGSTHVTCYQADPKKWDSWQEIRRVNPLSAVSAEFRNKLREELAEAQRDSRLKARFLSYRLNLPSADEAEILLTVEDFERAEARPVAARDGQPWVGVDLGAGRAWSAAVAVWPSGRTEAAAIAPGIPDLAAQEKRDRVPDCTYRELVDAGVLHVADGLHVPPVGMLWNLVGERWGLPRSVTCDRFRVAELRDAAAGAVGIFPRVTRWSDAAEDIRALRKLATDGGMSIEPKSLLLLAASLAAAIVKNDDAGNTRMVKRAGNVGRDDVAAALTLAAGARERALARPAVPFAPLHIPLEALP